MKEYKVVVNGKEYTVTIKEDRGSTLVLDVDGTPVTVQVSGKVAAGAPVQAEAPQAVAPKRTEAPAPAPAPAPAKPAPTAAGPGVVVSKVPGKILKLLVNVGDNVQMNQTILTMESMKMEIEIKAPKTGRVSQIFVKPGDYVNPGQQLMVIE